MAGSVSASGIITAMGTYRDDLEAAQVRIDKLEAELAEANSRTEVSQAKARLLEGDVERLQQLAPGPVTASVAPSWREHAPLPIVGLVGVVIGAAVALLWPRPSSPDAIPTEVVKEQAPVVLSPIVPVPTISFHASSGDDDGDGGRGNPVKQAVDRGRAAAGACPGVGEEWGHVMLRWAPSGEVTSVEVQAPYAGGPAEDCIRTAFMGAPLSPATGRAMGATAGFRRGGI
jgi:hypothetical protein